MTTRFKPTPSRFPDGTQVVVTGGRYAGDTGVVVNQRPDLRPGSVWVNLGTAGTHLVPGYRLARGPTHPGPAP